MSDIQLELDQDFQRREWIFQRVGWIAMASIVLAGTTGLFGDGVLSAANESAADGSGSVGYEKFLRKRTPSTISLSSRAPGSPLRVWISRESARILDIKRIEPQPVLETSDAERLVFELAPSDPGRTLVVSFHVEPIESAVLDTQLGVLGGPILSIRQIVFP